MKKLLAVLAIASFGCNKADYISLKDTDKSTIMFAKNAGDGKLGTSAFNYIPTGSLTNEYVSLDDYTLRAKFDGPMVAPQDIPVTYSIDKAAVATFNAEQLKKDPAFKPFTLLPDSTYTLAITSDVIKKGEVYGSRTDSNLLVHPTKIDPAVFYLLPIKVSSSAYPSSAGTGTIFIYIIGNPLAGTYKDIGVRWNLTGAVAWAGPPADLVLATAQNVPSVNPPTTAAPAFTYDKNVPAIPVDGQTISMQFGNVPDPASGDAVYLITANATFTAITYDFTATFKAGYSNIDKYVRAYRPPSPTQKAAFRLVTKYNNATGGGGNDRIVDETFTHL
jgi:hypothetical protein